MSDPSEQIFPVEQACRDLAWLLNAPSLVNAQHPRFAGRVVEFTQEQRAAHDAWLAEVCAQPQALQQWLSTKPIKQLLRLGRYAEHLLEFFLRYGPNYRLTAANVPIRTSAQERVGDKTTIGELDFLLEDQVTAKRWHWELAVKYFLCLDVPDPTSTDFVGPDAVEVFEYKLEKIFERQLRNRPPEPYAQNQWQSAAYACGWIFYPLNRADIQVDWLSGNHQRGCWLAISQLQSLAGDCFEVLNRQRWLSVAQGKSTNLLSRKALEESIRAMWDAPGKYQRWTTGVLIAQMQANAVNGQTVWEECARYFIVPDDWNGLRSRICANS